MNPSIVVGFDNVIDSLAKALCNYANEEERWPVSCELERDSWRGMARYVLTELMNDLIDQMPNANGRLN